MNKSVTYKIKITWNDWRDDDDNDVHEYFKDKLSILIEEMDGEIDDYTVVEHN